MCSCNFPAYNNFRTGLNFREIRKQLALEQKRKYENGIYMFITRATVLGRWHEIKLKMFDMEIEFHNRICNNKI